MRKIGLLIAFLSVCVVAQAGVVLDSFNCTFDDDPTGENHDWTYNYEIDTLSLAETYTSTGSDAVNMFVETDGDPTIHIQKTVENSNGHDWTSYTLTLSENDPTVYFLDTAFSNIFAEATLVGNVITYSGGIVEVGQTVTLDFDIMVEDAGSFGWCVTQLAIPEPATLAMLGLGSLALLRRKK